jgi:hypothetical protein
MKKPFTQRLAIFLCALLIGVPAQADDLEGNWERLALSAPNADGCAYNAWLSGQNSGNPQTYGDRTSSAQVPSRYLKFLDTGLKACSLSAGKDIPDPDTSENKWLEHFFIYPYPQSSSSADDYDAHFNHADALALAGPSVKDEVTRYWQQNGKTHIRFALNESANDLRSWAKRRGIALQLTRQKTDGPVYNRDPLILRGKTAIPVFIVSPEGLTPARIVDFAVGDDPCQGGNWMEVVLSNDATPPVWAVIALRDPALAQKAKVTRQRRLETLEGKTHYLEMKRGVLRLEFENDALPPLILVARQLGFKEGDGTGEETLLGSVWGTKVFLFDPEAENWYGDAFGRPISFLGSPRCPPPAPE